MMRTILTYGISLLCLMISGSVAAPAQEADTVFISKLELLRSKKKVFDSRDSVLVLKIDTLIMEDRAALQFYGKKHVTMVIKHAEIGDRVNFTGRGGQNNASDMDIHIRFNQLGSLYIMADGQDANNGMRTHPNGDGGNVRLYFDPNGIRPQQEQSKENIICTSMFPVEVSMPTQRVTSDAFWTEFVAQEMVSEDYPRVKFSLGPREEMVRWRYYHRVEIYRNK